jgi:hypothetical protein
VYKEPNYLVPSFSIEGCCSDFKLSTIYLSKGCFTTEVFRFECSSENFFYLPITTLLSLNKFFITSSKSTFSNELNRDQNESLMIKQIDEPHHLHANNPLETIFASVSQKIN